MRTLKNRTWLAAAVTAVVLAAPRAEALTTLSFQVAPGTVVSGGVVQLQTGETLVVDVVANMDTPIVGWGLDAVPSGGQIALSNVAIGPSFVGVFAPDGDQLAGLVPGPALSGAGVLLATLSFGALFPGSVLLSLAVTPGDLTEGFALQIVGGFDSIDFGAPLSILVTPEPSSALLLAFGAVGLAASRRLRRGARQGAGDRLL